MKEIIQAQFKSGKSLTKSKYHGYINKGEWPKFVWEFYPIAEEYYHELNPYFVSNYYKDYLIKFSQTTVVRDGYLAFVNFILQYFQTLPKMETGLFFIDPDFAPLLPTNISHLFGSWTLVHKNHITIEQADRVLVFGLVSDEYLGDLEALKVKLDAIKPTSKNSVIDIFLPLRRNVFERENKENVLIHEVIATIKSSLKNKKLNFIRSKDFFETAVLNGTYLVDLRADKMIASDSYLDHYFLSKGGSSSNVTQTEAPDDSLFSLELSPHHELHLRPLPQVKSFFPEILYHKRIYHVQDSLYDYGLKSLLRDFFLSKN